MFIISASCEVPFLRFACDRVKEAMLNDFQTWNLFINIYFFIYQDKRSFFLIDW